MRRNRFNTYINESDIRRMFIQDLGWNRISGQDTLPTFIIEEENYILQNIAERSGFQVFQCFVSSIPKQSVCKKIDSKMRRIAYDYICVYIHNSDHGHQLWTAPVKKNGKREIVLIEFSSGEQADFLYSKLDSLTFAIDERTLISDVKNKIALAFEQNSQVVTKKFYTGFRAIIKSFTKRITGIYDNIPFEDNRWKQWFASVMLNRLMFCYFIQKKGFLNGDVNYLSHKLHLIREQHGANQFYGTFYRGFLIHLFQDGLNNPKHTSDFQSVYGRIPFLNGGLFGQHIIEESFPDIDIDDQAFIDLFEFFDTWNWLLDSRVESDQKDINPDVLGYIFEQIANDKAKMGAFYTQEDITEYISKYSILPYILNKLFENESFRFSGYARRLLLSDPEKYIFESVKYGFSKDWRKKLPSEVSNGLNIIEPHLLQRRVKWNEKAGKGFGLKKESWRDAISRFERCEKIIELINSGAITNANDFITYSLDIRTFVLDLIIKYEDKEILSSLYRILTDMRIVDIACGSGAFLFASMNILEPIYEALFDEMISCQDQNPSLFTEELSQRKEYENNPQFFILKHIAVNNLYGVDIMKEAVETAKLRIFLKLASTLEINPRAYNMGLEPLPDLDFNLMSGNSLTGTTQFIKSDRFEQYSKLIQDFKYLMLNDPDDMTNISEIKNQIINLLRDEENSNLDTLIINDVPLNWNKSFYYILKAGGFDIVVGNPPYRENNKLEYDVSQYSTSSCRNVYTCMFERSLELTRTDSYVGMIVQLPIVCTDSMSPAQHILSGRNTWIYNFDDRPGKLFENQEHCRVSIFITTGRTPLLYSSRYNRWYTEARMNLFENLVCEQIQNSYPFNSIAKVGSPIATSILRKMSSFESLRHHINKRGNSKMYIHNAPLYFTRGTNYCPYFLNEKGDNISSSVKPIGFNSDESRDICCCLLNSTLFYMWFVMFSDCRHLNSREIEEFPLGLNVMTQEIKSCLLNLCKELMEDLDKNKIRKVTNGARNGRVELDEYKPKPSKPIMDKIDFVLAKHFNFTEEELDYIINYDVKFRMNDDV